MVAAISHDLRTPLASLRGYLETLHLKEQTLTDEEKRSYQALALGHGERLSRLIDDLFALAILEASDARIQKEPFLLNELASDIVQRFKLDAKNKQLDLITDIPKTATFVGGDIALIERVLENLIENAIKYTPTGGTVQIVLSETEGGVSVCVADTGQGIQPDQLPHIFERFFQAGEPHRDTTKGAGLGLAIAQRILHLHDGDIAVKSTPGAGTSLSFRLSASNARQS